MNQSRNLDVMGSFIIAGMSVCFMAGSILYAFFG